MNDEILKFMVENAEGWRLVKSKSGATLVRFPNGGKMNINAIKEHSFIYEHLLTRACEGLGIVIEQTGMTWGYTFRRYYNHGSVKSSDLCAGSTTDEAKEAALTAVWEETP